MVTGGLAARMRRGVSARLAGRARRGANITAHRAAVALAEGRPDDALALARRALGTIPGHAVAENVIRLAGLSQGQAGRGPLTREAGGDFFLQHMQLAPSERDRGDWFRPLVKGRDVLHVGCVDSPIFDPARNLHIDLASVAGTLHGLDIDLPGLDVLRGHCPGTYFGDVESCLAAGHEYDLILAPETIEHVPDARSFLLGLDRIPAREIVLTAPCFIGWGRQGIFSRFGEMGERGRYGDILSPGRMVEEVHPDHKYWFSPYTLANLVTSSTGWELREVRLLEDDRMVAVRCAKSA